MTHAATPFAESRHGIAMTAALATLFWIIAAAAVLVVHAVLDPFFWWGGPVARAGAIVLSAYAYTRLCARQGSSSHALGVGIAWLGLGIVTEIVMTMHVGHGWYGLLGSPDRPLLRNLFLFVWIFAPAFFARREGELEP